MKVLIVGSGGREHAIAYSCAKSARVDKIYCAPGNAGIGQIAECVPIGAMEFEKLAAFAKEKEIDFTIIGMDDPLVGGVVDVFEVEGLKVFGPRKNAAILEGSKAFSKDLMKKYNIPTAGYENFDDADKALAYLETAKMPIVLKADGLALGKGVLICNTLEEAKAGVKEIMLDKKFGDAGNHMVIEEFMFLFVGQHIWEKNLGFLLDSLVRLSDIPFRMYFVGSGYASHELKQKVVEQIGRASCRERV